MIRKSALLITIFFASISIAQHVIPSDKIGTELQSFYQHPSASLLTDIVQSIDADSSFLSKASSHPPIIGFLTVAFSRYKEEYDAYQSLAIQLKYAQDFVRFCLDLSQTKDTILNWTGHDASLNDLHWGGFFASGDSRYIDRIVSEMQYCERTDSLVLFLAGASAKWSLCSNAKNFPEVKERLEELLNSMPADLKSHIKETLNSSPNDLKNEMSESIKHYSDRDDNSEDGSLSAIKNYSDNGLELHFVLIGDRNFFEEWEKPETPKISPKESYKRGDELFPIIIFSTDGKDENGNANLTYDIKIIKPDGTVYGEFKQLEVWKDSPAPEMHLIKQPVTIRLEESDLLGIYKIESTVYENNKNQKIDFKLNFQVVE